jgi:hypothetical protein
MAENKLARFTFHSTIALGIAISLGMFTLMCYLVGKARAGEIDTAPDLTAPGVVHTVNPKDGKSMAAVWLLKSGDLAFAHSADGGKTWSGRTLDIPARCDFVSNPVVSINPTGNVYVAFEAHADPNKPGYQAASGGIFVAWSVNGGKSFFKPLQICTNTNQVSGSSPSIASDNQHSGKMTDGVFVAWLMEGTKADGSKTTQVMMASSHDFGSSFPWKVQLTVGDATRAKPQVSVVDSAILNGRQTNLPGMVTVSWQESDATGKTVTGWSATSSNRGQSFFKPVAGSTTTAVPSTRP